MKFTKTNIGEGEAICDKCNKAEKRNRLIEIRDPTSSLILHEHREVSRCSLTKQ